MHSSLTPKLSLASFAVLVLASAYLGLSTQKIPQYGQSDKGLHFITFFLLTVSLETRPLRAMRLGGHEAVNGGCYSLARAEIGSGVHIAHSIRETEHSAARQCYLLLLYATKAPIEQPDSPAPTRSDH